MSDRLPQLLITPYETPYPTMKISKNSAVTFHYHLTSPSGDVIDSSRGGEPLAYIHGHGNLVEGVEEALLGMTTGETTTAIVPPEKGYGTRNPNLDVRVPITAFPEEVRSQVAPGGMFHGQHPSDPAQVAQFRVIAVEGDQVLATGNHQLAGDTLHFELEVISVREATAEELAQGHIHGPDEH